MERRSCQAALGAAILVLVASCGLFSPRGTGGRGPDGFAIRVTIAGLSASGGSGSRSIFSDSRATEVLVTVRNASLAQVGSGYLTKGATSWEGLINVSELGQLYFAAEVSDSSHLPLYKGSQSAVLETGSEDVAIGVSRVLVGEWLFAENANDSSGSGANGAAYGNATLTMDRFSDSAKALALDGDGDYVVAAADALPTGERTVSLWFYADSIGPGAGLLGYGGNGANGTSFWENLKLASNSRYTVGSNDASFFGAYASEPIGRWVHWATTTSASGSKIYIDGIEFASDPLAFGTAVGGADLFIGCAIAANGASPLIDVSHTYFDGRLDDVRIYDCALSATEVGYLYHERDYDPRGGLVGEWLFSSGASDTSGYGHDGTPTNGAALAADRFSASSSCYNFDGSNDYINVPGMTGTYSAYTISFWRISLGGSTTNSPTMLYLHINTYFQHIDPSQGSMVVYIIGNNKGNLNLPHNAWQHVLLKCDGTNCFLYVDGVLTHTTSSTNLTISALQFGGETAANRHFYGLLDDVRIYNRSLAAHEILALYHEGGWDQPAAEPSGYPVSFAAGTTTSSSIPLSWTDASGSVPPEGYLIKWSPYGYADIADPVDHVPEADGSTRKNVAQGVQACTLTGLASDTTYYFKIWPYTNSGLDIDYKIGSQPISSATTLQFCAMVTIGSAGDSFTMGDGSYGPNVTQTISYDYQISKFEITNSQFAQFIADGGYSTQGYWTTNGWNGKVSNGWTQPLYWTDSAKNGASQPVVGVSWYEAVAFCNWRSLKEGLTPAYGSSGQANIYATGYHLPTEVEWEYAAAKGGPGQAERIFAWGDSFDLNKCVCADNSSTSAPVGSKSGAGGDTPQGLADMDGNVWEWCSDNTQGTIGSDIDRFYYLNDTWGTLAVLHGSSWEYNQTEHLYTFRLSYQRSDSQNFQRMTSAGFRVVRRAAIAVPVVPSGLTATASSSSSIHLAWSDNSSDELGFRIERSPDGSTGWTQIAVAAANAIGYDDTGLSFETTYYYRIRACNGGGSTAYTSTANAKPTMGPEMISVTGGVFTQGRQVLLSGYKMGKYEVTFSQYDAFCNATSRSLPGDSGWGRGTRPVFNVTPNVA